MSTLPKSPPLRPPPPISVSPSFYFDHRASAAVLQQPPDMKRKRGSVTSEPQKFNFTGTAETSVDPGYYSVKEEENDCFITEERNVNTDTSGQHVGLDKPLVNNDTVGSGAAEMAGVTTTLRKTPISDRVPLQGERVGEREPLPSLQNAQHKEQELDVALSVISEIMKMDAAVPFNDPVDPIVLGIPDYLDIIDTPMDFGKIRRRLENGIKYMNSEDVLKDVQYIWDNCCKYNKKGSYILELMKRVKNNFMKLWTAAGLYKEPQNFSNGNQQQDTKLLAESTMREKDIVHTHPGLVHSSSPCCGLIGQPQQRTFLHRQSSSQLQAEIDSKDDGILSLPPPIEPAANCSKGGPECQPLPCTKNTNCQISYQINGTLEHSSSTINNNAFQQQENAFKNLPESSPSQLHSPADYDTISQKKSQGRRPTQCFKMLREGKRISIITNELDQPVGPEVPKLVAFLGTLARDGNLLPLTYLNWRAVPQESKENIWEKVQLTFEIDLATKDWVLESLRKKWKNWKCNLKTKHYDPYETNEERLADRDERVLPDQWAALIALWNTETAQKHSATNRANRMRQKYCHATGRKSFACIREEQRANRPDGKAPSRAELFILTRTRKNGQPINEACSAVITQLQDQEIGQNSQDFSTDNIDILSQIVGPGKRGNIRCVELGPIPSISGVHKPTCDVMEKMAEQTCAQTQLRDQEIGQNSQDFGKDNIDILSQIVGPGRKGNIRCEELSANPSISGVHNPTSAEATKTASDANVEIRMMKEKMAVLEQTCAQMALHMMMDKMEVLEQTCAQMALEIADMKSSMHEILQDKDVPNTIVVDSDTTTHSLPQQVDTRPSPCAGSSLQACRGKRKI